jgi:predicted  nucleic acid-binding Zn-ribbon protein
MQGVTKTEAEFTPQTTNELNNNIIEFKLAMTENIEKMTVNLTDIKTDVAEVKSELEGIKSEIMSEMVEMKSEIASMKSEMSAIREDMNSFISAEIKSYVGEMKNTLCAIVGI